MEMQAYVGVLCYVHVYIWKARIGIRSSKISWPFVALPRHCMTMPIITRPFCTMSPSSSHSPSRREVRVSVGE